MSLFYKIWPSKIWLKDLALFLVRVKELNFFFVWLKELKFFFSVTHRMNLFFTGLKELNLLLNMIQRLQPFFHKKWPSRIEPLFIQYDSKNWIWLKGLNLFLFQVDSQNFFKIWLKELNLFFWKKWLKELYLFFFSVWLKQLNPLFEHVSMTWTLFDVTQRIEPFSWYDSENWTFLFTWLKDLSLVEWLKDLILFFLKKKRTFKNWTFLKIWLKELNLFFQKHATIFSWIWRKEFNPFFLDMMQRIDFSIWLKELSFFSQYDSKNWTLFLNMSHWIEPFFGWLKELNFFSIWLKALSPLLKVCFKEMNLFYMTQRLEHFFLFGVTQRIEPFSFRCDSKNWTLFSFEYDAKNWTSFSRKTQRIETFFESKNWTSFFWYDSKNWTLFFEHVSMNWTLLYDSKNWTFFFHYDSKKKSPLIKVCFKELNIFCMTQRLERFILFDVTQRIAPSFFYMIQRLEPF